MTYENAQYTQTLQDVIDQLTALIDSDGLSPETPVFLAQQPSWPFEYSVGRIEAVDMNEPDEDDYEGIDPEDDSPEANEARQAQRTKEPEIVIFIGEGSQLGYLPGAARRGLDWSGR